MPVDVANRLAGEDIRRVVTIRGAEVPRCAADRDRVVEVRVRWQQRLQVAQPGAATFPCSVEAFS